MDPRTQTPRTALPETDQSDTEDYVLPDVEGPIIPASLHEKDQVSKKMNLQTELRKKRGRKHVPSGDVGEEYSHSEKHQMLLSDAEMREMTEQPPSKRKRSSQKTKKITKQAVGEKEAVVEDDGSMVEDEDKNYINNVYFSGCSISTTIQPANSEPSELESKKIRFHTQNDLLNRLTDPSDESLQGSAFLISFVNMVHQLFDNFVADNESVFFRSLSLVADRVVKSGKPSVALNVDVKY
uniref:Uncharacterized protein n=1 Tax=Dikerogammarus haemobaphes virus 1 TaxID=2704946 RepID=A0A6G9HE18_9VIRU|nr:hypothetical protein [Dikerogammarus haemobaphes virus 1]